MQKLEKESSDALEEDAGSGPGISRPCPLRARIAEVQLMERPLTCSFFFSTAVNASCSQSLSRGPEVNHVFFHDAGPIDIDTSEGGSAADPSGLSRE